MEKDCILIVEDEQIVALDLQESLKKLGYNVPATADCGEKVLALVRLHSPDIILMDVMLKGEMTGIDTAYVIHKEFDIPIVYLTAFSDDHTIAAAKATGPYSFIIKPVDTKELKTTLEVSLFKFRMEKKLKASEERFREIFEQNFDAIILFKLPEFLVIDVNPAAVNVFGFSRAELMANFQLIFENRDIYSLFKREICKRDKNRGGVFLDRCRLRTRSNGEIICAIKANIIKIQDSNVLYCTFHDITESIHIENESRQLHARLIQANKMTALGTLASGIAHEINNPNNYIMSNTQIVQQIWPDTVRVLQQYVGEQAEFSLGGLSFTEVREIVPQLLQATLEGSRRIKNITENLKEFSKPKEEIPAGRVHINEVLDFSIAMLSNEIKRYTDSFTFKPGERIPPFAGNSQQIEQVVVNLIQNALHALPNRGCGVQVATAVDEHQRWIIATVRDEGVGMHKSVVERITDPFFTTKQDRGGTGLGLYVSYAIVKKHGGILDFDSSPGCGTTAIIKFPIPANAMEES